MTKLKYVIEIDTQRVPHQFDDDKNLVVSVKHGQMLEVLYRADMSWEARRELNQTTSIDIKSVEVLGE